MEVESWTRQRRLRLLISTSFEPTCCSMIRASTSTILSCDMIASHHTAASTTTKHSWIWIFLLLPWTTSRHRILVVLHLSLVIILRSRVSRCYSISHRQQRSRHLIVIAVSWRLSGNCRQQVSIATTLVLWLFKALVIRNWSILLIVLLVLLMPLLSWCSCSWLRWSSHCGCIRDLRVIVWCCTAAILWEEISNTLTTCRSKILHHLELLLLVVIWISLQMLNRRSLSSCLSTHWSNSGVLISRNKVIVWASTVKSTRTSIQ